MPLRRRRTRPEHYEEDDDRSFAVALRLEIVAKRMAAINAELAERLAEKEAEGDEGSASA